MIRRLPHVLPATALLAVCLAAPAGASPDTLRHGLGNLLQAPFDIALAPVTAAMSAANNRSDASERTVGQVLYPVFAWPGLMLFNIGNGFMRVVTGVVHVVAGIPLFPFDTDLPPKADPFGRSDALLSAENPLGDSPAWLKYVPPLVPFTVDLHLGVMAPGSVYESEPRDGRRWWEEEDDATSASR